MLAEQQKIHKRFVLLGNVMIDNKVFKISLIKLTKFGDKSID
ncbi:hypothetical protein HMPREF0645_0187 [Hallella bergensis DSM 17361]|uniref:Uncharacterized protein n=1 Tax=Hallella bergensis DSM 17361 TaxID=585502 RepID=D1PTA2_9BACT|nr:hypothetical protein HMPREF0645_0187 [Hallella bergensis DSM 17361]